LRRRQELLALAHEFDTLILEDDAYGELRFEGETLPPLYALDRGGRVIRAGTLSKILGAGVRLGWLCAPKEMIPPLQSFLFGGGEAHIRLAFSCEQPDKCYEGARLLAKAMLSA